MTLDATPDIGVPMSRHNAWWKSKKFVSYMVGEFLWKAIVFLSLVFIALYNDGDMSSGWLVFLAFVVVTAGAAQMGYLGGQSWIDRYTSVIKVPAEMGKSVLGGVIDAVKGVKAEKAPVPAPVDMDDEIDEEDLGDDA
jgi:hypothetical protein